MQLKALSAENTMFAGLLTLCACIFIGKSITVMPPYIPLVIVASCFIFLVSFTKTNVAMLVLIYAMLLSPEISLGAVSKQRAIVIRVEDLLIILLAATWFAKTAMVGNVRFLIRTPINRFIAIYTAIFIVSTAIGMLVGVRLKPVSGLFYVLKYIEYFLVFFLTASVIKDKKQIKSYLKAFLITFAIVNIYACTQIGSGRVSAPFEGEVGEPNTLGGYQVLMLGVSIGLITTIKSKQWRILLIASSLFCLIPFAFTLSRASYMAILPMYMTLIFYNKSRNRNVLIALMMIIIVFSIFFFPENVKERISSTFTAEYQENIKTIVFMGVEFGPSASARLNDWIRLFNFWKKSPFFGYGITGMGFLDSQYIRTLVELGLVGFVAFWALMISIFRNTRKIYHNAKDDVFKGLALGFLAGHVGLIFHGVTANTFILIRIMEPYWFLMAMVMMIPKLESTQEKRLEQEAILTKEKNEELEELEEDEDTKQKRRFGRRVRNSKLLLNYGKVS